MVRIKRQHFFIKLHCYSPILFNTYIIYKHVIYFNTLIFLIFFKKSLYKSNKRCYTNQALKRWDIAKLVRQWILTPSLRRFESYYPSQRDYVFCNLFFIFSINKALTNCKRFTFNFYYSSQESQSHSQESQSERSNSSASPQLGQFNSPLCAVSSSTQNSSPQSGQITE